jgi:hypothetical protein
VTLNIFSKILIVSEAAEVTDISGASVCIEEIISKLWGGVVVKALRY